MWIFPIAPESLAHPKQCPDCGKPIIWAKDERSREKAVNPGSVDNPDLLHFYEDLARKRT